MDSATQTTTISNEVDIVGTIKSKGSVRIDGKLDGELQVSGDATIGKTAVIKGNVHGNSVIVEGSVNGNITAQDKIDMKSSARVNGDIRSKRLAVEDGVTFIGKSEVNPSGAAMPAAGAAPSAPSASSSSSSSPAADDAKGGDKYAAASRK